MHKKYSTSLCESLSTYVTRQSYELPLPIPVSCWLFNHLPAGIRKISEGGKLKKKVKMLLIESDVPLSS